MGHGKPRRVAVIDDDEGVREWLRSVIALDGHQVETFGCATEFVRSEAIGFDCAIVDHNMPGMTGVELVAQLRAFGIALPIMLLTGNSSPALVQEARDAGVDQVVYKPPKLEPVLSFIRNGVRRGAGA